MIDSVNGYAPINKTQNISTTGKAENIKNAELFKQLLGKAVDGGTEAAGASGTMQNIGKTELLPEISAINNVDLNSQLSEIETQTDELIEQLSLYSDKLENSNVSLKDINELLEEIKKGAENLLQKSGESEESMDKELIDIVRECAITAHSEYIKFQRGDYLDSYSFV
ncbi:MAG: hypothetical protein AB7U45_04670 [Desulfamplus sp.]